MQQLYRFDGEEVTVTSLKVTDRVISKIGNGEAMFSVRLHIELNLEEKQLAKLPLNAALVALVEAGKRKVGDGPNTTKLDIKRKFPRSWCRFSTGDGAVELKDSSIALTPNVRVVEGKPSLRFWVETSVSQEVLSDLVALVRAEGVGMFTDTIQASLFKDLDGSEKAPEKPQETPKAKAAPKAKAKTTRARKTTTKASGATTTKATKAKTTRKTAARKTKAPTKAAKTTKAPTKAAKTEKSESEAPSNVVPIGSAKTASK